MHYERSEAVGTAKDNPEKRNFGILRRNKKGFGTKHRNAQSD
jgi:hypothetical protein